MESGPTKEITKETIVAVREELVRLREMTQACLEHIWTVEADSEAYQHGIDELDRIYEQRTACVARLVFLNAAIEAQVTAHHQETIAALRERRHIAREVAVLRRSRVH